MSEQGTLGGKQILGGRAWVLPAAAGVGGLVLGVVIGVSVALAEEPEPEVVVETVTETVEVEIEPADVAEQRSELSGRMDELDARAAELGDRDAELDERAADLVQVEEERAAGTFPGDGTFLVGTDIESGQYRNSGTGSLGMCYWARLSGTSGDFDELITNGLTEGQTVVTIRDSDVAFETQSCGEWTRV